MIGAFISLHITGMEQKNHYTIRYTSQFLFSSYQQYCNALKKTPEIVHIVWILKKQKTYKKHLNFNTYSCSPIFSLHHQPLFY